MKMMQQGHAAVAVSANARRMLEWLNLTSIGTMGWMFRTFCVRANGPIPKLLLFWTGTLMSLATGFWTAFCKLAAPSRLVWLVKRTPVVLQTECQRKESTKATTLLQSLSPLTVLRPRRPACGSEARLKRRTRGCTFEAERVRTLRTSPGIFSSCTQLGMASISLRRSRQLFPAAAY